MAPQSNLRNFEGVVALKALSNGLLAVLYTSGLFRIVQISYLSVLVETELLEGDLDLARQGFDKISEAKLAFQAHNAVADADLTNYSKSISLGLTTTLENPITAQRQSVLHCFSLRFESVSLVNLEGAEDAADLGRACELINTRREAFPS